MYKPYINNAFFFFTSEVGRVFGARAPLVKLRELEANVEQRLLVVSVPRRLAQPVNSRSNNDVNLAVEIAVAPPRNVLYF